MCTVTHGTAREPFDGAMPPKRSPKPSGNGGNGGYRPVSNTDDDEEEEHSEAAALIAPSPRGGHIMQSDGDDGGGDGGGGAPAAPPSIRAEIPQLLKLSIPMQLSQLVDGLTQQISIMMIGHLGPEMLGAAVLATMFVRLATVVCLRPSMTAADAALVHPPTGSATSPGSPSSSAA